MLSYIFIGALLSLGALYVFVKYQRKRQEELNEIEFERNPDTVFMNIKERANPQGGLTEFYKFIKGNLYYPEYAKEQKIEGFTYIQFIVEKDGSLSNMTVAKGLGFGCDEAAMEVIMMYGNWIPASIKGQPARQKMVIPIVFRLKNINK